VSLPRSPDDDPSRCEIRADVRDEAQAGRGESSAELKAADAAECASVSDPGHDGTAEQASKRATSYRTAMRATSVTGSSALVVMALRVVRSKVIAVLLGPSGVGLFGLLTSTTTLVATAVGFGINSSGTRQVAAASGEGDHDRVARTIYTLRRTSLALGLLGSLFVVVFSEPLAVLATGDVRYSGALAILGLAILFRTVSGGQTALLRGLRKIKELAKLRILGALLGTLLAVPLVWLWKLDGLAPAIVTVAALSMLASWIYARRIRIPPVRLRLRELRSERAGLAGLGAIFLILGFAASLVQYLLRVILSRRLDLAALGQFQAASTLSLVYVGFVLKAMGLDFMPRLTEVADDDETCNRLVNEQSEISLLLAGPGIVATVVLAPVIIQLFYSAKFGGAVQILRWQCLGVLLQVASWPIAFVLVAKGKRQIYLWTELAAQAVHLCSFWLLTHVWGLMGAAAAYAVMYVFFLPLDYFVVRRMTGFGWTSETVRVFVLMLLALGCAVAAVSLLPSGAGFLVGTGICCALAAYSYRELSRRVETPVGEAFLRAARGPLEGAWARIGRLRQRLGLPKGD